MKKQAILLVLLFVVSIPVFIFLERQQLPEPAGHKKEDARATVENPTSASSDPVAGEVPAPGPSGAAGVGQHEEDDTDYSYLDAMSGEAQGQEQIFPEGVNTMQYAAEHGDPRTPPIVRSDREYERATQEELQDEELYREYELRQQQRVYKSFIDQSEKKIAELEKMLEMGEEAGLPEQQLQEARDKIQGLQEMREKLINENPDLAE